MKLSQLYPLKDNYLLSIFLGEIYEPKGAHHVIMICLFIGSAEGISLFYQLAKLRVMHLVTFLS